MKRRRHVPPLQGFVAKISLKRSMEIVAAVFWNDVDVAADIPILGHVPARFQLNLLRSRGVVAGESIGSSIGQRPVVHAIPKGRIVGQKAAMNTETLALLSFQAAHVLTRHRRDSSGKQRGIIASALSDGQRLQNSVADDFLDHGVLCIND